MRLTVLALAIGCSTTTSPKVAPRAVPPPPIATPQAPPTLEQEFAKILADGSPRAIAKLGTALEKANDPRAAHAYELAFAKAMERNPGATPVPRFARDIPAYVVACTGDPDLLISSSDELITGWDLDLGVERFSAPIAVRPEGFAVPLDASVAYSWTDGRITATALPSGAVRWQADAVTAAVSADGKIVALATGADVTLVDPETGAVVRHIPSSQRVGSIDVSSDGSRVLGASAEGMVAYDAAAGRELGQIRIPQLMMFTIAPDGARAATFDAANGLRMWALPAFTALWSVKADDEIEGFRIDARGGVVGFAKGTRFVWPPDGGAPASEDVMSSRERGDSVCPDGRVVGQEMRSSGDRVFAGRTKADLREVVAATSSVMTVALSTDARSFMAAGLWYRGAAPTDLYGFDTWISDHELVQGGGVTLLDVATPKIATRELAKGGPTAVSANGKRAATIDGERVVVVDLATGATIGKPFPLAKRTYQHLEMSADGSALAIDQDGEIDVRNVETGKKLDALHKIAELAFAASGHDLVAITQSDHLVVRDVDHRRDRRSTPIATDGNEVAAWRGGYVRAPWRHPIELWSSDGVKLAELPVTGTASISVARDRDVLLRGGFDGTASLWDLGTKTLIVTAMQLRRENDYDWLVIAPDGRVDGAPAMRTRLAWQIGKDLVPGEVMWERQHAPGLLAKLTDR